MQAMNYANLLVRQYGECLAEQEVKGRQGELHNYIGKPTNKVPYERSRIAKLPSNNITPLITPQG